MRQRYRLAPWFLPSFCVISLLLPCAARLAFAHKLMPAGAEAILPGVWRGVQTKGYTTFHYRLEVKREGEGYTAEGIAWAGMTELQAQAALGGQLSARDFPNLRTNAILPTCLQQHFTVSLKEDTITFQSDMPSKVVRAQVIVFANAAGAQQQEADAVITRLDDRGKLAIEVTDDRAGTRRMEGVQADRLLERFAAFGPEQFVGRLIAPGLVAQDAKDNAPDQRFFRLWREDALRKPLPLESEKGTVLKLGCLDGTRDHYTCYLPKSYDPGRPTPVVINSSPDGNAQPLSVKMAESLGWIMAGLTESQNGSLEPNCRNRDAVLFDLRRRFNIDPKRLYFAGFSGGARSSALSALSYPDNCAGLLCIGASCQAAVPPLRIPIYFLAGATDPNRAEVTRVFTAERRAGRTTELAVHPGGHSWGRPEDHEEALRWLRDAGKGEQKPSDGTGTTRPSTPP